MLETDFLLLIMIKFLMSTIQENKGKTLKTFVCRVCGHIAFNEAPVECPVCKSAIENFDNDPAALMAPVDSDNLSEFEKKHIPVIEIDRSCNNESENICINVQIKVGMIEHVMRTEHFIDFIDVYIDKKYFSRVVLTPKRIYPSVHLKAKVNQGVLSVIAHCNVHGYWRSKLKLEENC